MEAVNGGKFNHSGTWQATIDGELSFCQRLNFTLPTLAVTKNNASG
jgi:hypothetical protein